MKDLSGKISIKDITFTATKAPLCNNSSLSANTITFGSSVTVRCAASGGRSPYKFAIHYKKAGSETWTLARDYSTTDRFTLTPKTAASYTVRVRAKDAEGKTAEKLKPFVAGAAIADAKLVRNASEIDVL